MNHHYMLVKIAHRDGRVPYVLLEAAATLRHQAARGDEMSRLLLEQIAATL